MDWQNEAIYDLKSSCFKNKDLTDNKLGKQKIQDDLFPFTLLHFTNLDKSMKKQIKKILLFIYIPLIFQLAILKNVKMLFFLANCTSMFQSLDLGISHSVKINCRRLLMKKITTFLDKNTEKRCKRKKIFWMLYIL